MLPYPEPTPSSLATAAAAAFCIGLTKAGFSGFSLVAILLTATILPAKESTGMILPMLIMADLMAIGLYSRHVDWRELGRLFPSTLLGLVAGWILLDRIPGTVFGRVLGWTILAMMLLVLWQRCDRRVLAAILSHPALASFTGFIAGVTTMMANAGGPAMTFHLLARNFSKMVFVGTSAWFFFLINLIKVPFSLNLGLISSSSLRLNFILLPAIALGVAAGRLLLGRVSQSLFEKLAFLMALVSAFRLILG